MEPTNIWMDFTSDNTQPILNNTMSLDLESPSDHCTSVTINDTDDGWSLVSHMNGEYSGIKKNHNKMNTYFCDGENESSLLIKARIISTSSSYGSLQSSEDFATLHTSVSFVKSINEILSNDNEASLCSTVCNILPCLQGSALFAMPFAVAHGGLATILFGILLSFIAYISSSLVIDCLYAVSPQRKRLKRIYGSYADLAIACMGKCGGNLLTFLNIFGIVANNVVNIILVGECAREMFGNHIKASQLQLTMLMSLWFLPPTFITKLSVYAYLSMFGVVSILIGGLSALTVFTQHVSYWKFNFHQLMFFNLEGISLSMAILMFSLSINPILPQVEGSMKKPGQIGLALGVSYGTSTLYKMTFGIFGALTYGLAVNQLVSINTSTHSRTLLFVQGISLCVYAYTNFALIYFIVFEKIDEAIQLKWNESDKFKVMGYVLSRIVVVVLTVSIAILIPYFALVAAVIGAIVGTFIILVTPFLFHLQLKWRKLSCFSRMIEIFLLLLGFVIGGLTIYSSVTALVKEVRKAK